MSDWKDIGSNIIKLEGFGVYITLIDDALYQCPMTGPKGLPKLDEDKCIDWEEMLDPPNQEFLNIINKKFRVDLCMHDFGGRMSIQEVKAYTKIRKEIKEEDK